MSYRDDIEEALDSLNTPFGIYHEIDDSDGEINDFEIVYVNQAAAETTGISKEEQIGKKLYEVFPALDIRIRAAHNEVMKTGKPMKIESSVYRGPVLGGELYIVFSIELSKYKDNLVVLWRDITSEREESMATMSRTEKDQLTGLLNPSTFRLRLEQALAESKRYGFENALLLLDLDHFKAINDQLGHIKGNKALFEIAQHLKNAVRETDAVGRFGGDAFTILLTQASSREAAAVAQHLNKEIAQLSLLEEDEVNVTASIGIVDIEKFAYADTDSLLKEADKAMYLAKSSGGNRSVVADTLPEKDLLI